MSRFHRGSPDHHPTMSNLELAVFDVLNADTKLKEAPRIEGRVFFRDPHDGYIYDNPHHPMYTRPDFLFPKSRVLVYLDGPHHQKKIHSDRDDRVNEQAIDQGWHVQRVPYDGRYTKKDVEYIAICIRSAVNHHYPYVEVIEL